MGKPILISPDGKGKKKTRVAAYCRVSTNSADQKNSYAQQLSTYTKMISRNPEWEMVDIFADEGLSGMKADNREDFQRMIRMCELRQIDLILTKSVSRFARNTKEALQYVRMLKNLGIGVKFEEDGINTMSMGDEMLLSTFAAVAQAESESISKNVRMGNVKRMERGEYIASNAPYGFRMQDKQLVVYEPEAEVVRSIYKLYLNGWSASEIARELTQRRGPTKHGKSIWRADKVSYILSNERYVGDCLYQKKFSEKTVPFKQHKNRGEEDMYYASDTHPPLLDRELFEKVQVLRGSRLERFAKTESFERYPLTSRIRCAECGSFYHRKISSGVVKWVCAKHAQDATTCKSSYYSQERIYDGFTSMVNKLRFGQDDILGQIVAKLSQAADLYKRKNQAALEISGKIQELNSNIVMLQQLHTKGYLASDIYQAQAKQLKQQVDQLKKQRQNTFDSKIVSMLQEVQKLQKHLMEIEEPLEDFNELLFTEIVKEISIDCEDRITITFLGGLKFTELI